VSAKLTLVERYQLVVTFGTTNSEVLAYFVVESEGLMIKVSYFLLCVTVAGMFVTESFLLKFEIEFVGLQSYGVVEGMNFKCFFSFFVELAVAQAEASFQEREL
jgi:hypothetical protein